MKPRKQHVTKESYNDRLKIIVKKVGGSEAAAKIIDKSAPTIERYKKNGGIDFEDAVKLALKAGHSAHWLATGEELEINNIDYTSPEYTSKYIVQLDTVQAAAEVFFQHIQNNKKIKLTPEKAAKILVLLVQIVTEEGEVDETNVIRLVDLAS